MVVFKDDVRNGLIVADPEKRGIFTAAQCELINGHPLGQGDQDDLQKDVLDITEQELKYWEKRGLDPHYLVDKYMTRELKLVGINKREVSQVYITVYNSDGKKIYGDYD